jgi:hypothetical protein
MYCDFYKMDVADYDCDMDKWELTELYARLPSFMRPCIIEARE